MSLFALHQPIEQTIADAVSDAVAAAHEAAIDPQAWLQDMAALQLAYDLADEFGVPVGDVWYSLCNLPQNILTLLESPQGWSTLSAVVAFDMGLPATGYGPTVH